MIFDRAASHGSYRIQFDIARRPNDAGSDDEFSLYECSSTLDVVL